MGRERHFKAFDLSDDGLATVHSGFLARQTLQAITDRVQKETGEVILVQALGRYRKWWTKEERAAREAREYARELAASLKNYPAEEVRRFIEQKMEQLRLLGLRQLEGKDPLDIAYLSLSDRKVRVKEREVELTARKVAALEAKVGALEAQRSEAQQQAAALIKSRRLDPETVNQIREIYGLGQPGN